MGAPVALALRGERAGVRGATFHPRGELAFGAKVFRAHSQPPLHLPAAHFHEASSRRRNERVRLRRVYANQHSTLAACCHGHVAPDEEREPAEHLLLGQIGFSADQFAYAICEFLVIRHDGDRTAWQRKAVFGFGGEQLRTNWARTRVGGQSVSTTLFSHGGGQRTPGRTKRVAIPAGEHGAGVVGALQKVEKGLARVVRGSHRLIWEEREVALTVRLLPARRARTEPLLRKAGGLGRGVGIERRFPHLLVSGPESEADELVRVGLAGDEVGVPILGCACAREAGHCEIETVPEQVHGARLAAEPAREVLERPVDPAKRLPKALNRLPIVRGMLGVLGEGRRHRESVRLRIDVDLKVELGEDGKEALVQGRYREPVGEPERIQLRAARPHDELVRDEIERDVEIASP